MDTQKAVLKNAWPYQQDQLNLPVADLEAALPFYETRMGFQTISREDSPHRRAVLQRDGLRIGLAENGGDPTQDGCFFEVNDVEAAFQELKANGLTTEMGALQNQHHGETAWKVFFVVAPDGLCYCFGERQG